jgi:Ca-activated chloride channel family protein
MKNLYAVCILLPGLVLAGTSGFIAGTVTDAQSGDPLQGANIIVVNQSLGAASDINGNYLMMNVPAGEYDVSAAMFGYQRIIKQGIVVINNDTTRVDFKMTTSVLQSEAVTVMAKQPNVKADVTSSISSYQYTGAAPRLPMEAQIDWNTEEYDKINETGFREVLRYPMSTFAADVDAASYSNARRFIMQDELPLKDAVRIEEFVNYFNYDYPEPADEHPLSINIEYGQCPWNSKNRLISIGLQGKKLKREDAKPSNLVFLLDVSGSMDEPKKLPLLQKAFNLLVDQLENKDRVAIVVYAGAAGVVLPSTSGSEKPTIKAAIDALQAGGSTAGGEGIRLAYDIAKKNFIKEGNNRVILATDGDFNVGISSTSELTRFIEEKRNGGIFLTVLGFGMGNYKDNRLQELADRGNGNHAYIDNILEARKVLVSEIAATLYTIAKDVKIQVEFNPAQIGSYRLLGYENRRLNDEDFTDDKKDAGEIGAGHTVTALYEVVPSDPAKESKKVDLKYQTTEMKPEALKSDEVLTVRIRYKEPDGDTSREFSKTLEGSPLPPEQLSDNFRFASAAAEFAMILAGSEFKAGSDLKQVKELAQSAIGQDVNGYRAEFLTLVNRVEMLKK